MHALMAADALATYPDHNKWFNVYTDAPDFQFGGCMNKKADQLPTFLLSKSEQNNMVMENEMLSIVATLDKFQSMLLGLHIHVFTHHKN
ncbi:LOW QUALITY PROTEIN: hypothetical protein ACHAW6_011080 [Cyclotella cf. meneghiniana]